MGSFVQNVFTSKKIDAWLSAVLDQKKILLCYLHLIMQGRKIEKKRLIIIYLFLNFYVIFILHMSICHFSISMLNFPLCWTTINITGYHGFSSLWAISSSVNWKRYVYTKWEYIILLIIICNVDGLIFELHT